MRQEFPIAVQTDKGIEEFPIWFEQTEKGVHIYCREYGDDTSTRHILTFQPNLVIPEGRENAFRH